MINIYKYELEWMCIQQLTCNAVKILDIQVQNGKPVLWAVVSEDEKEARFNIYMRTTGGPLPNPVNIGSYISTTQHNSFVAHWFTDFKERRR